MKRGISIILFLAMVLFAAHPSIAEDAPDDPLAASILKDNNGDGLVTIAAFGDSITRGEGDFVSPGSEIEDAQDPGREASYPFRIETFLGIPVSNWGVSGEALTQGGESRFLSLIQSRPDIVIIAEGTNDSRLPATPGQIYRALQKMINAAKALGTQPVLTSILPVCCGHAGEQRFIDSYNPQIRVLAGVNEVPLADAEHAFRNSCDPNNCALLSRPEGLHPNVTGYDVLGEAEIAALLGINLFAPDGPTLYAMALAIDPTQVRTVPDPVVVP